MTTILVTGAQGLIGRAVCTELEAAGYAVEKMDLRRRNGSAELHDVTDAASLDARSAACQGIIHLAAVSRVAWGERNPELCWQTNVEGTRNILRAAAVSPQRPWVLFASSREVYGDAVTLPVAEDHPLLPMNVYGCSKAEGERMVTAAREQLGLPTAVARFSNVYGDPDDHADRVVPAFCKGAVEGADLEVCGFGHVFDFTHLDDTVRGILQIVGQLESGERNLPPIHLATGHGTTLLELARLANRAGGRRSRIIEAPQRDYDVARFVGDPTRAHRLLGWGATTAVEDGIRDLVERFAALPARRPLRGIEVESPGVHRVVAAS